MKRIHEQPGERLEHDKGTHHEKLLSPLEVMKKTGGVAHQIIPKEGGRPPDGMLAVYRERLTYTFILNKEVASIHFERGKREIYFRGHNILNMELSPEQVKAMKDLQGILSEDEQGKLLFNDYVATLGHILADKHK
ncbi:MAG: hypothetical protein A3I09_00805 [Deltaproteobacteria bacterium RIFCSPLOWO2_02_FULL_47_10]|nr:MAG: hypothetical protein A3I09_00805 [Deltaproteobacteria bacterium RIFCSPLOWO2_02_FULL_47_10]